MTLRSLVLLAVLGYAVADDSLESLLADFEGEDRRLGDGPKEFRNEIFASRMCHSSCGKDAACHAKCPSPWKPLVEACRQAPTVMACHRQCAGDAACIKACPSFAVDWIQKKFEKNPEGAFTRSQRICPRLEKAYACHQACTPGDSECHHKCPHVLNRGGHHDHDEKRNHDKSVGSSTCESCLASGQDFCIAESKCIPRATFKCRGPHDHVTGDRWFALHGNPEGIQHKMSCPGTENFKKEVEEEKEKKVQIPVGKGCFDKGKYGVWCPKAKTARGKKPSDYYCVRNCRGELKKELKPDAKGCYDKGEHGVWCPKGADWYCVKNCKPDAKEGVKSDSKGCWLTAFFTMLYDSYKAFVSDLPDLKQVSKDIVV